MEKNIFKVNDIWFTAVTHNDVLVELNIIKETVDIKEEIKSDISEVRKFLNDYMLGNIYKYNGKIELTGTDKQKEVMKSCMRIPIGEVLTYKELSEKAGIKNGERFVGNVMANNKLILIMPCHRIVPAEYRKNNNRMGNYGPGEHYKKRFLKIERGE